MAGRCGSLSRSLLSTARSSIRSSSSSSTSLPRLRPSLPQRLHSRPPLLSTTRYSNFYPLFSLILKTIEVFFNLYIHIFGKDYGRARVRPIADATAQRSRRGSTHFPHFHRSPCFLRVVSGFVNFPGSLIFSLWVYIFVQYFTCLYYDPFYKELIFSTRLWLLTN